MYKYQFTDKALLFLIEFTALSKDIRINKLLDDNILMYRHLIRQGYMTATENHSRDDINVYLCRFTLTNQGILALAECVMYSDLDMLYDNAYRRQCKGQAATMLSADFGYKGLRVPHHHPLLNTENTLPRALVYFNHGCQQFTMKTFAGEIVASVSVDEMRHYELSRITKIHQAAAD